MCHTSCTHSQITHKREAPRQPLTVSHLSNTKVLYINSRLIILVPFKFIQFKLFFNLEKDWHNFLTICHRKWRIQRPACREMTSRYITLFRSTLRNLSSSFVRTVNTGCSWVQHLLQDIWHSQTFYVTMQLCSET